MPIESRIGITRPSTSSAAQEVCCPNEDEVRSSPFSMVALVVSWVWIFRRLDTGQALIMLRGLSFPSSGHIEALFVGIQKPDPRNGCDGMPVRAVLGS